MKYRYEMQDSMLLKRIYYNYTDFDSLAETTEYIFDDENEIWLMDFHELYFYNDNNRLDYSEYEDYNEHIGGGISGTYSGIKDYHYVYDRIYQIIETKYIDGERQYKYLQEFDEEGRRNLWAGWTPVEGDTSWFMNTRTEYQYNESGKNTYYLSFRYYFEDGDTTLSVSERFYDESGKLIESNSLSEGLNRILRITYDEENRVETETNKLGVWPSTGYDDEILVDSTLFQYSEQIEETFLLVPTEEGIDTSSWTRTTHDLSSGSSFKVLFTHSLNQNEWIQSEAWESNILENPQGKELIHHYWVESGQYWKKMLRNTSFQNDQGRDTAQYEYIWSSLYEQWTPKTHLYINTEYNTQEVDSINTIKRELYANGTWETEKYAVRKWKWHDDGGLILYMLTGTTNLLSRVIYDENDRRIHYEHAYGKLNNGEWNIDQKWKWYYSDETYGYDEIVSLNQSLWYNSGEEKLYREQENPVRLQVYSLNGVLVFTTYWSERTCNISFLDQGIYMVLIVNDDGTPGEKLKIVVI
jgi:hypothetical protein